MLACVNKKAQDMRNAIGEVYRISPIVVLSIPLLLGLDGKRARQGDYRSGRPQVCRQSTRIFQLFRRLYGLLKKEPNLGQYSIRVSEGDTSHRVTGFYTDFCDNKMDRYRGSLSSDWPCSCGKFFYSCDKSSKIYREPEDATYWASKFHF